MVYPQDKTLGVVIDIKAPERKCVTVRNMTERLLTEFTALSVTCLQWLHECCLPVGYCLRRDDDIDVMMIWPALHVRLFFFWV